MVMRRATLSTLASCITSLIPTTYKRGMMLTHAHADQRRLYVLLLQAVMNMGKIPVHSYGRCLHNTAAGEGFEFDKREVFSRYKFCFAMENSVERDYVTEKVYDGLDAGCLPIYLGAENIADFVPVPGSVVEYNLLRSPERLIDELLRLLATPRECIARTEGWRGSVRAASAAFRRTAQMIATSPRCRVCQLATLYKRQPGRHDLADDRQDDRLVSHLRRRRS